jgi:hypothetical protein
MKNSLQKIFLSAPALALSFALASANPSHAATVDYNFDVTIDSGSLVSNSYKGSFSYDDVTNAVFAFVFNFDGVNYDQTYDPSASVSQVGGNFLGLVFSYDGSPSGPTFSFVPGTLDVSEAFFAYDTNITSQPAGFGSILYQRVNSPSTNSVPAPMPFMGAAAFFAYSRKLRSRLQASRSSD